MTFTISFTNQPSAQTIDTIHQGLEKHAKKTIGATSFDPFGFLTQLMKQQEGDLEKRTAVSV